MGEIASLSQTEVEDVGVTFKLERCLSTGRFNQLSFPGSAARFEHLLVCVPGRRHCNYGSNSHGYRKRLSELRSQSSDQDGAKRKPPTFSGNSRIVKGHASSAGMPLYLAFDDLEASFPPLS